MAELDYCSGPAPVRNQNTNQERYMKKQNKIQVKDLKARKDVKGGVHLDSAGGSKVSGGSHSTTGSSNKQSLVHLNQ
jgi:hypothetical protein